MLKVHILTDDRVRKRGLLAEHGLSLWIEKDSLVFNRIKEYRKWVLCMMRCTPIR
jgi:hypothetical protein